MSNPPPSRPQFLARDILWLCVLIGVITLCTRAVFHAESECKRLIGVVNSIDADMESYSLRVTRQSQRIAALEKRNDHILDCWFFTLFRFGEAPHYDGYMLAAFDWVLVCLGEGLQR